MLDLNVAMHLVQVFGTVFELAVVEIAILAVSVVFIDGRGGGIIL